MGPYAVRQGILGLAMMAALASPALADDDVASEFGLGTVPGFPSEGQAQVGCGGDSVVWADRRTGFYYPKFAPEYGNSPTGSFTCYKQAKKADYWGMGGGSDSMASRRGRNFPFTDDEICIWFKDKGGNWRCGSPGT